MNNRKKASYGMKKMRGGDYMEPNKELKFGAPMGKKPKRRRAANGDTVTENNKAVRDQYSIGERLSGKMREDIQSGTVRKPVKSKVDSKGNQMIGTDADIKKMESMKAKSKSSGSYSEAKKRDANLDSYIKSRNAAEKGSREYNEAQNKINRAYGKGPTNRPTAKPAERPKAAPAPMKTTVKPVERGIKFGESKVAVKPEDLSKAMAEQGLKQAGERLQKSKVDTSPTTPSRRGAKPSKENKIKARAEKKIGNIQDRRAKAADKQADRQFKKNERQGAKDDRKNERLEKKDDRQLERGAKSVQKQQKKSAREDQKMDNKDARLQKRSDRKELGKLRKEGRAMVKQARKNFSGGGYKKGRKKANMGMLAGVAGNMAANAMQNSENETVQKIGKGIGMASQFAGAAGGGGAPQPAAKKGRYKAKSGFGMLSVKAGIDNNPNPTRADAIAGAKKGKGMKDRRRGKRR